MIDIPAQDSHQPSVAEGRQRRVSAWLIFFITLLAYGWFFPRWADPNQNSRLDMVVAIVEDHSFQIDRLVSNTVDYAKVGDHYYSDKAPGVAFLGVPLYAGLSVLLDTPLLAPLTEKLATSDAFASTLRTDGSGVSGDKVKFALAQVLLSFVISAIPSAALCALIYLVLLRLTASQAASVTTALAYGLFTPAFAYANAFYGHQFAAFLLFAAFALVFFAPAHMGKGRLLLVGVLLGYAVVTEYPAALMVAVLFLYLGFALYRRRQLPAIVWTMVTGGVIALLWFAYNTVVFGGPLELGYSHSELWMDEHSSGFMSLTQPTPAAFWGVFFSPFRGLFLLAPWLLLALPGYMVWAMQLHNAEARAVWLVSVTSVLLVTLFNISSVMWWGGFSVGPRYLLPALPFLALPCGVVMARWQGQRWFRVVTAVLLLWSALAVWAMTLADQAFPSDALQNPWRDHVLPAWQNGYLARSLGTILGLQGVLALLPLLALLLLIGLCWYWFARPRHEAKPAHALANTGDVANERQN